MMLMFFFYDDDDYDEVVLIFRGMRGFGICIPANQPASVATILRFAT